jgi:hypothetical protein
VAERPPAVSFQQAFEKGYGGLENILARRGATKRKVFKCYMHSVAHPQLPGSTLSLQTPPGRTTTPLCEHPHTAATHNLNTPTQQQYPTAVHTAQPCTAELHGGVAATRPRPP